VPALLLEGVDLLILYRFLRRAIWSAWLDFPRTGVGACVVGLGAAGTATRGGGAGAGTATAAAAGVAVFMETLTSSSDSPEDESSPPMSNDSMLPLIIKD
jgi:hypothetical protein